MNPFRRPSILAAVALAAVAGMGAMANPMPAVTVQEVAPRRKKAQASRTGQTHIDHWGYAKKERVSVRQHQRASRKRRNVLRNRKAQR